MANEKEQSATNATKKSDTVEHNDADQEGDASRKDDATKEKAQSDAKLSKNTLDPNASNTRKSKSVKSVETGAKLKMPSTQASALTRAHKRLLQLQEARGGGENVLEAIEDAERELSLLKKLVDQVLPANIHQQKYKNEWMTKYLVDKEADIVEARQAWEQNKDAASVTSSVRLELARTEEEEAKLALKQKQIAERHERRRKQREEEEREQQEQDDLELELHGIRARREALRKAVSSKGSSSGSSISSVIVPPLPRLRQPTDAWLDNVTHREQIPPPQEAPPSQESVQGQLLQHVLLAQARLPVFKGDPLEYPWFKQSFQAQVENVAQDPRRKLHLLLQHVQGEPHTLIKACQLAPDAMIGFERAKHLLDERYGDPIRVGLAFKKQLLSWPPLRTSQDLTSFSVQLLLCHEMMAHSDAEGHQHQLADLNAATTLLQLASKLAPKPRASWQMKAVDIEVKHRRAANFADFVSFVQRQERARNHPVYGNLRLDDVAPQSRLKTFQTQAEDSTLSDDGPIVPEPPAALIAEEETVVATRTQSASADSREPLNAFKAPCLFCNGPHATAKCAKKELSRKEKQEKLKGLCFACLKPGHSARFCRFRLKCDQCHNLHPTVLHEDQEAEQQTETTEKKEKCNLVSCDSKLKFAIATLYVELRRPDGRRITIRALLDAASTATFISTEAAQELDLTPSNVRLLLTTMTGEKQPDCVGVVHGLEVSDTEANCTLSVPSAYVVNQLPQEEELPEEYWKKWPHLAELPIYRKATSTKIDMLIGLNVDGATMPLGLAAGILGQPYAVKTPLGWAIHGPVSEQDRALDRPTLERTQLTITSWSQEQAITQHLRKLFLHDFDAAYEFRRRGLSVEDHEWLDRARASIQHLSSGQYMVELPFRMEITKKLQDNREQAAARLNGLRRRFRLDPDFCRDYRGFMQKMIDAGHVERASESPTPGAVVNYVPHHGVYHPQKRKIRVVFNCANRFANVSLNDCLLSGPDLTNSILGVLIRFRQFRVAFMADIKAMFYQVLVPVAQRDALRFLWWPNGGEEQGEEPAIYRMRVHLFGATSSPSIANFALRHAADEALEQKKITKAIRDAVHRNFYVDDCLRSARTETEAIKEAHQLMNACQFGGFKLGKFVSNSVALLQSLDKENLSKDVSCMELNDNKADPLGSLQERALGVAWSVAEDTFVFRINDFKTTDQKLSKRVVLAELSRLYDPLGMAAPVVAVARALFRRLVQNGQSSWDEDISETESKTWTTWRQSLPSLGNMKLQRCYTAGEGLSEEAQMHTFSDASTEAYAAAVYLRSPGRDGKFNVTFVVGKTRVSPLKAVTIPRLELTAAKLATELADLVQTELDVRITNRVFWTDSLATLGYITNTTKRFHVFVANRVNAILNLSQANEWRYVPSALNPADEGTRGIEAAALATSKWIKGPSFLCLPEKDWPSKQAGSIRSNDPEVKCETATTTSFEQETVATTGATEEVPFIEALSSRYSSMHRLRKAVAIWLRVKSWLKTKQPHKGPFQWNELHQAEKSALAWLQRDAWDSEYYKIKAGTPVGKGSSLLKLSPFIDENGVIRMNSRIRGQTLPIVPVSRLSQLLILEAHEAQAHLGRQITALQTQRRHWILGLNKQVRKLIRDCPTCQRFKAKPRPTIMAELHETRLKEGYPFETTGVDYFGPFLATNADQTTKLYGIIFTCPASRAAHLEVAEDLSSSSFINALRRFTARRGPVKRLLSDNGTNLAGANTELLKEIKKQQNKAQDWKLKEYLGRQQIQWAFNPPGASHFGGIWERLIRIIRDALEPQLRATKLNSEAMQTLLCECEAVLNARPLTTVNEDANDVEALTPNHLLLGRGVENAPPPTAFKSVAASLRNQWKRVQHLSTQFWRKWTREYKALLHQRTKWFRKNERELKEGDVVMVVEPLKPRQNWRLGRVTKVIPSADKEIRVVEVRTSSGSMQRPIVKLCLLEAASPT